MISQLMANASILRGSGRGPTIQAQRIKAGATTAFSLLRRPRRSARPLHTTSCRTTAAYTARQTPAAAMSSARPITFAIASTLTGCTAKINPATSQQGHDMRYDRAQTERKAEPAVRVVHGTRRIVSGRQTSYTSGTATLDSPQCDCGAARLADCTLSPAQYEARFSARGRTAA